MEPEPLKLPTHCSGCGVELVVHPLYVDPSRPAGDYLGLCSAAYTWGGKREPSFTCWGRLYAWLERTLPEREVYKLTANTLENNERLLVRIDEWLQLGMP